MRGRKNQKPSKAVISSRWIPGKADGGKLYASFSYVLHKDLSIGLDYRPLIDEVQFLANWRILSERQFAKWSPALVAGTSREDYELKGIQKESRAYYLTLSKSMSSIAGMELPLKRHGMAFSPYIGAAYIEKLDDLRLIGGLHLRRSKLSSMLQYSGRNIHASFSYDLSSTATASFILWGVDDGFDLPGLSLVYRF